MHAQGADTKDLTTNSSPSPVVPPEFTCGVSTAEQLEHNLPTARMPEQSVSSFHALPACEMEIGPSICGSSTIMQEPLRYSTHVLDIALSHKLNGLHAHNMNVLEASSSIQNDDIETIETNTQTYTAANTKAKLENEGQNTNGSNLQLEKVIRELTIGAAASSKPNSRMQNPGSHKQSSGRSIERKEGSQAAEKRRELNHILERKENARGVRATSSGHLSSYSMLSYKKKPVGSTTFRVLEAEKGKTGTGAFKSRKLPVPPSQGQIYRKLSRSRAESQSQTSKQKSKRAESALHARCDPPRSQHSSQPLDHLCTALRDRANNTARVLVPPQYDFSYLESCASPMTKPCDYPEALGLYPPEGNQSAGKRGPNKTQQLFNSHGNRDEIRTRCTSTVTSASTMAMNQTRPKTERKALRREAETKENAGQRQVVTVPVDNVKLEKLGKLIDFFAGTQKLSQELVEMRQIYEAAEVHIPMTHRQVRPQAIIGQQYRREHGHGHEYGYDNRRPQLRDTIQC